MRTSRRLGVFAAAAAAALALAGAALAAFGPSLTTTQATDSSGADTTDIAYAQTNNDDPLAQLRIFVPVGFSVTLNQAVGTQIGTVPDGTVVVGDLAGAVVPVTGTVVVGDPTSATLKAAAKVCTGSEDHNAIWLLNVAAGGTSLPAPVPLYVDTITGSPVFSAQITLCLPPPPLATLKIKLLTATLHMTSVFSPSATAGSYRFTALNIPYAADNSVNLLGAIETQSIVRTPVDAGLTAKRITKTRRVGRGKHRRFLHTYFARLSGTVNAGGEAATDANVDVFAGKKKIASASVNANGSFTKTFKLTKTTTYHFTASAEASDAVNATCDPPLPTGLPGINFPCGKITQSGFAAASNNVTVKKPKPKKRKH
jgi:hypothetical protein